MFCKYCGKVIDDDSVFCDGCGRQLKEEFAENAYIPEPSYDSGFDDNTESLWEKETVFQSPEQELTLNGEKTITPDSPLIDKKSKAPYILLPIAVIIGAVASLSIDLLAFSTRWYTSEFITELTNGIGILLNTGVYLIVLVLFSLCCKGANKRIRFIISGYVGMMGYIISSMLIIIVESVFVILGRGFWSNLFLSSGIMYATYFIAVIPSALISLMWFASSEKNQVNRKEKSKTNSVVAPSILLAVFLVVMLIIYMFQNELVGGFLGRDIITDYSDKYWLVKQISNVIFKIFSLGVLLLFSLSCKGGDKKLIFVGSVYMAEAIISGIVEGIFYIWSGGLPGVGRLIIVCLIIPATIGIYVLYNRYSVEKIKKIKE